LLESKNLLRCTNAFISYRSAVLLDRFLAFQSK
jgi:hypothetical protein